jgi:FkbM family methyltransferase
MMTPAPLLRSHSHTTAAVFAGLCKTHPMQKATRVVQDSVPMRSADVAAAPDLRLFRHRVPIGRAIADRVRQRLGLWLFRASLPVFVRGTDPISLEPLVNGYWEHVLQALFRHACVNGFNDFFIDIGANIGLTSCQCGNLFKQVLMFEPNPEIFPILELNTGMVLRTCERRAFNFGLGPVACTATLNVLADNFGGAFVHDEHNAYSDALFARKHLQASFDLSRYRQVPIRIAATAEVLPPLFAELHTRGLTRGVIKLDVEGYEQAIIADIAACLPAAFGCLIVFENWDANFDVESLLAKFPRSARAFQVIRTPEPRGALWKDLPGMMLSRGAHFALAPVRGGACEGDIVIAV